MNALEFLNTELSEAGLNFRAYETGFGGAKAMIRDSDFKSLYAVVITITSMSRLRIRWTSEQGDASKALEFARIMHSVGAIANRWEQLHPIYTCQEKPSDWVSVNEEPQYEEEDEVYVALKTLTGETISIPQANLEGLEYDEHEVTFWETGDGTLHELCLYQNHPLYEDGWYYSREVDGRDDAGSLQIVSIEEFDKAKERLNVS